MWLSLALALLKSFPALRDIFYKAVELDKARNEAEALKRKQQKADEDDAAVLAARNAVGGMPQPNTRPTGEQQANSQHVRAGMDQRSGAISQSDSGIPENNTGSGIRDREEIRHEPNTK